MHDDAGHVGFRQYRLEDFIDEAVPVLAAEQAWDDRVFRQGFPAPRAAVLERQYEGPGIVAVRTLPQRRQVDTIRPVTSRIDKAVFTLIGNKEFFPADISLDRDQRFRDRLFGKTPWQHSQFVVRGIPVRTLRGTSHRHEQQRQQPENAHPRYHGIPIVGQHYGYRIFRRIRAPHKRDPAGCRPRSRDIYVYTARYRLLFNLPE